MLHIILTILKILGCVLLGVLALLLTLILIVLFVPIKYEASGSYYESPEAQVKVLWLFGALKAGGEFNNKKLRARVSFLWFKLLDTQTNETKDSESQTEAEEIFSEKDFEDITGRPDGDGRGPEREKPTLPSSDNRKDNTENGQKSSVAEGDIPCRTGTRISSGKALPEKEDRKKKNKRTEKKSVDEYIYERIEFLAEKLQAQMENINHKLEDLSRKKDKIEKFIDAECTQNSMIFVKKLLWSVIQHILPKSISGTVHFGLGRPSTTGKVLGYASMFYALYGDSVRLWPDFEHSVIEGDLCIKGSFQLYIFLYWGLRGLLNKDIRKLIKYIKHIKM